MEYELFLRRFDGQQEQLIADVERLFRDRNEVITVETEAILLDEVRNFVRAELRQECTHGGMFKELVASLRREPWYVDYSLRQHEDIIMRHVLKVVGHAAARMSSLIDFFEIRDGMT